MFNKRNLLFLAVFVSIVVFSLNNFAAAQTGSSQNTDHETIRIDVAEDASRFVFDEARLFDDGMPAYGTPFVTQGYIYPEGTLNGSNGVLEDGSPEFPDLVLGEWTCYGYLIGDGMHTETGTVVVSTQLYQFDESHGNALIVTNGFELADLNVPIARAISGGTGIYQNARGEQVQELLGFTDQMGVNLRIEFNLNGVEASALSRTSADNILQAGGSSEEVKLYPWD